MFVSINAVLSSIQCMVTLPFSLQNDMNKIKVTFSLGFLLTLIRRTSTTTTNRPYFSAGGWRTFPHLMVAQPGPCNIEIRDNSLTQREFLSEYAETKPFIVRDSANNDLFRALARK